MNGVFNRALVGSILCASVLGYPLSGYSHEGHAHAPGEVEIAATTGPIVISSAARENLQIATVAAEVRPVETVLTALGKIEPIPGKIAAITSRISGRVSALFVADGQTVKKGQPLLEIESRQLGDPPPRITFTAPFDGMIVDQHAALGESVEPNAHMMEVLDASELYAAGQVPEGQLAQVAVGQRVRVRVEAYRDQIFEGEVELLAGALDPATRTLRVWTRLKNDKGLLRPNMRATLAIVTGQPTAVIVVPNEALLGDAGERILFVQSESDSRTFERRSVITGSRDDRFTEVVQGVFPGELIVTRGGYQLQYVTPQPTDAK